jgi:GNAT superfamily N-acetyltransferase
MRWFGPQPKHLSDFADRLCESNARRCALGAFIGDELVGVGNFVVLGGITPTTVEFALVVAHDERLHGVGTLILDRLEDEAYRHGARRMVAEVMGENAPMLQVIRDRGWAPSLERDGSTLHLEVELHGTE